MSLLLHGSQVCSCLNINILSKIRFSTAKTNQYCILQFQTHTWQYYFREIIPFFLNNYYVYKKGNAFPWILPGCTEEMSRRGEGQRSKSSNFHFGKIVSGRAASAVPSSIMILLSALCATALCVMHQCIRGYCSPIIALSPEDDKLH